MAKNVFSESDVYALKKALALWSAKNDALIKKYEELLKILNLDEDELYSKPPSSSRDASLYSLSRKKHCYLMFLKDLRKPCDSFISQFERVNHDDSVLSKEIDNAMRLDLENKERF